MKRKILGGILAAGLLAGLMPALAATQAVGSTVPGGGGHLKMCQAGQEIHVDGPWGQYVLKNNDFYPGARPICITHDRTGPDFQVTASRAASHTGESDAYPNIFLGCSYNHCDHGNALPAPLFRMRNPWVSYYAKLKNRGKWDANLDRWVSRHEQKTGIVTGGEVMIWFSSRGFGHVSPMYKIHGIRWHLVYWRTRSLTDPGVTWPLIIFHAVPNRGYVRHLPLMPFFRILKHLHLIHQGYWLDSVHAGFEIWRGGKGFKLQWFRFHKGRH